MKKRLLLFFFLNYMSLSLINAKQDTLRIYYNINKSELTYDNSSKIIQFLNSFQIIDSIKIYAYADYLASNDYNLNLSEERSLKIKDFLIQKGFANKIKVNMGKGELLPEITDSKEGVPENRRSEIIVIYHEKLIKKTENKIITDVEVGDKIVLKNFNFLPGRHYLTPESQPELEKLLSALSENPRLKIEIQGHICCEIGGKDGMDKDTYTNNLSVNRAKYIYDYLIKNNIASDRLSYKGLGSSKPLIYPERTENDQNQNRRVEIVILQK